MGTRSISKYLTTVVLTACGGAQPSPATPTAATPSAAPQGASDAGTIDASRVERICGREQAFEAQRCGPFGTRVHLSHAHCTETFATKPLPDELAAIAGCLDINGACDPMLRCMVRASEALEAGIRNHLRACTDAADGRAVGISSADYAQHNGSTFTQFAQVASTKAAPIERCSVSDASAWLVQLKCADGSRPIHDKASAEAARVGNVGSGGRCGAIVDLYRVSCPEGAFDIYIDAYECPNDR